MLSTTCEIALHVLSLLLSTLDFVSDWIFYESARTIQQGLVYGRVEPSQVTAILVFSIIGSVLFIAEIVAFVVEIREIVRGTGKEYTDVYKDLLSAIITWVEDIPQFIISVVILLCREEAVSVFQLIKAAISILEIFIETFVTIRRYCRQKSFQRFVFTVRVILATGMMILLGLSIAVFVLSQTEKRENSEITFREPSTVVDDYVSDQKYFAGVGVFLRDAGLPHTLKGDNRSDNWMRLFPIYELKAANIISMKLTYSNASNFYFNMGIWLQAISANIKRWNLSECYNINQDTSIISPQSSAICLNDVASGTNFDAVYMDFRFQFPESDLVVRKLVFGEIYFNCKIYTNGLCMSWNSFVSSVKDRSPILSYFRVNNFSSVNVNKYFHSDDKNVTRLFSDGLGDITSVEKIWKTGWNDCPSTGSMSPVFDTNMNVECN